MCTKKVCAQKKWGKGKVKREISGGAGLIFKGSGFYITDYRSDKYKEAAKKDSGAPAAKPSGGSDAKSDAKAAPAKSESHAKPSSTTKS